MVAKALFVPPVPNARLVAFEGVDLRGTCADNPAAGGGRVLMCNGRLRAASRFKILNHDPVAVAWCVARVNEWYFGKRRLREFGPVAIGLYPPVPRDWSWCNDMLPMQTGVFVEVMLYH